MKLATITSRDPAQDAQEQLLERIAEEQQRIQDIAQIMHDLEKTQAEIDQLTRDQAELERQIEELEKELGQKGSQDESSSGGSKGGDDPEKEKKLTELLGRLMMTNQEIEEKTRTISTLQVNLEADRSALDRMISEDSSAAQNIQKLLRDAAQNIQKQTVVDLAPAFTGTTDQLQRLCERARSSQTEQMEHVRTLVANDTITSTTAEKASAAAVQQAVQDMGNYQLKLAQDTATIIQAIVDKQGDISHDQADLDRLKAELDANEWKLYIPFYDLFQISYIKGLRRQIEALEGKIPGEKAELNALLDQLKDKVAEMSGLDRADLLKDMAEIGKLIAQLLDLLKGTNLKDSQGKFEQANVLLVAIMSILKVILAKAASKKGENDDLMSKATMGQYQYAVQDANNNARSVEEQNALMAANKSFMDDLKIAMLIVAILTAPMTDGASFALFAAFETLQQTGVTDKFTDWVATELKNDGMSDDGAKWLAEGITFAIILVGTLGTGAASNAAKTGIRASEKALETEAKALARELADNAFRSVARGGVRAAAGGRTVVERTVETAVEKECLALEREAIRKTVEKQAVRVADRAITGMEIERSVKTVARAAAKEAFEAAAKDAAKTALRQTATGLRGSLTEAAKEEIIQVAQKAASKAGVRAAENSLKSVGSVVINAVKNRTRATIDLSVDKIAQKEAASAVHKVNWKMLAGSLAAQQFLASNGLVNAVTDIWKLAAKDDPEKDSAYKTMQVIMQILQVIMMMGAGYGSMSASGVMEKAAEMSGRTFFGASREKLQNIGTFLQVVGDGITSCTSYQTMEIHNYMNHLHTVLAENEKNMILYKSTLDRMQKMRESESDVRAAMFEQQERSVQRLVQNAGAAEREIARLLVEKAV